MNPEIFVSSNPTIKFIEPDIKRDSPFAVEWFNGPEGKDTQLMMGIPEKEIIKTTLELEEVKLQKFIDLDKENKQITRMISVDHKTIGVVWIELIKNHNVEPASIHIMIGNPEYRRKGIGSTVMKDAVDYSHSLGHMKIYSRHVVENQNIAKVFKSLGFKNDGEHYHDEGKYWQNVSKSFDEE